MKKITTMLAFLLAFSSSLFASYNQIWEESTLNKIVERKVLRVGLDAGYMPFEMTNKQGKIVGFDVDVARQMAKSMGVELEIVNTAWDGIIPALVTDKFDIIMSGMTLTSQRNLQINFANPYIVIGQSVLLRNGLKDEIKSYKDLNNPKYTVVSKLGTTGDLAARRYLSKARLRLFETESEGAIEVVNGKADAFIYDLPFNAVYSSQNPGKLVHLDTPFTYEPLAWGVRKGDPDFVNWLNNFLTQIQGDGTYDKIYAKWFESSAWQKTLK
ncbi:transporter substrate-binding domain-containing protein [Endozoicomonas sp. GU-1]|uniref:transporter substrate-binding domain-containing protein n=1 Tax=Endozoicomonas sp. GU-1 TaxID=3009078 RepID=UPI0022B3A7B5|nr:transporter substrate-binding domain-containing protein [Endozoicomonas sp. GU-1]WBA80524.1 transporter substrate-binding domain-containing protein [Endozoicomonas sp. GU-1]WBA88091.1 transporter substrate-binding domain-containing protein [Endozoicomonas sp. GU-1]